MILTVFRSRLDLAQAQAIKTLVDQMPGLVSYKTFSVTRFAIVRSTSSPSTTILDCAAKTLLCS